MRACRRLAAGSFEFGAEVAQFRAAEGLANLFEEFRLLLVDVMVDDLAQDRDLGDVAFRARIRRPQLLEQYLDDVVLFERLEHHRFVTRREPVTRGGVKTFSSIPVWRHSSSMILEAVRSRVV